MIGSGIEQLNYSHIRVHSSILLGSALCSPWVNFSLTRGRIVLAHEWLEGVERVEYSRGGGGYP